MRILTGLVMMAALGATAASAQPGRLSDTGFMQAARCAGLASSPTLSSPAAASLAELVKAQKSGRDPYVLDKADEMRRKAKREADKADPYTKSKFEAELQGMCAQLSS
jgi:hypothetical protein